MSKFTFTMFLINHNHIDVENPSLFMILRGNVLLYDSDFTLIMELNGHMTINKDFNYFIVLLLGLIGAILRPFSFPQNIFCRFLLETET